MSTLTIVNLIKETPRIEGGYSVIDNYFSCSYWESSPDDPFIQQCECNGSLDFNISEITGIKEGLIQAVKTDVMNGEIQLNGNVLTKGTIFPITESIIGFEQYNTYYSGECSSNYLETFVFKHSIDGGTTWGEDFTVEVWGKYNQ